MHEVHQNSVWIGNAFDARDPEPLFQLGIRAVIDVAYEEKPAVLSRQLIYCRFPRLDGGGNDFQLLLQTLRSVLIFLESDTKLLVACSAGMSRSPSIAAFALGHYLLQDPETIVSQIASIRSLELKPMLWADLRLAFQGL